MFSNFPGKFTLFGVFDLLSKYDVNIIDMYSTLLRTQHVSEQLHIARDNHIIANN